MKCFFVFSFFLISYFSYSQFLYNKEDALNEALIKNKFILVYFQCNGYKPSIKLQMDCWNNDKILEEAKSLVLLKVDVPINYYFDRDDIKKRYSYNLETSIIHILDPTGKIVDNIDYYENSSQISELIKLYSISIKPLNENLNNYKNNNESKNSLLIFKKYLELSLITDEKIKNKIINLAFQYLAESEKFINKNDFDYRLMRQKMTILKIYGLAYEFKFKKVFEKLSKFNLNEIDKSNVFEYWFLKHLCSKGLNIDVSEMEQNLNKEGLEEVVIESNTVFDIYKKSLQK